jgi:PAS domain S-box-containing protein
MEPAPPYPAPENAAVAVVVLSRSQDNVEAINSTLRKAGHAARCTWLPDAGDLGDALIQINPELLVLFSADGLLPLEAIKPLSDSTRPRVPIVLVAPVADEATVTAGLRAGAQDVVSLADPERVQLVCGRELRAFRLERALARTLQSAHESQRALSTFMEGSADAIALVQEGVVVEVNPAWLDLFGYPDPQAVNGEPLMDLFDADSHASMKGAVVACLAGKWSDHALRVTALLTDGSTLALDLELHLSEFEGERAVRCVVPARRNDAAELQRRLADAVRSDPVTGLLHRRYFIEELRERLKEPVRGGIRCLACVRPDRMEQVVDQIGPLLAEDFITEFAGVVREQSTHDLGGRFTGSSLMFLVERGTERDVNAWGEHLLKRVDGHVFKAGAKSFKATATVGLCLIRSSTTDPADPVREVVAATRTGRTQGGNRVKSVERKESDPRLEGQDVVWVKHIKAALMENRFRLVQQPIASLLGEDKGMFDVLVRMLDEHGKEVLPSEFLPAAQRNDLMKNIDRWVVAAAMAYCAAKKPAAVFVRLSHDTLADTSLAPWLSNQLRANRVDPPQLCFQVPQQVATEYLSETGELRARLREQGFRFAIEHLGAGSATEQLVTHLAPEFIKIDGTLMQSLATNVDNQERVRSLVAIGKNIGATTIAERVEDANTMAVLWQLGIEFIQGYFVQKPEEVILG